MDETIQLILGFVEGRISAKEFEQIVYSDPSVERLLKDESLQWRNTYIKSNPYDYLVWLDYDDLGDVMNAEGAMELFLQRRGIPFRPHRATSDLYNLLLAAQPAWLSVGTAYLQRNLLPDAGDRKGAELSTWLRARLEQLFRYYKSPPRWIQSPNWPMNQNGPMHFLGQIDLDDAEYFHDEAAAYLFFDPATGETKTVIQVA